MAEENNIVVGRRKCSTARVWLKPGTGEITINKRPIAEFFGRETHRILVKSPFVVTENENKYDVFANVNGGGETGQAGAIRHGISRSLLNLYPELRPVLKRHGFLTRDPRMKERKKYGQKGARARFQFSKR